MGPAPTPRSPRRPPGPPSSAHVTAAGSPQTTLSATAGTHGHAASGAGPTGAPPQTPPPAPRSRPRLCLHAEQAGALVPMASPKGLFGKGGAHCGQGHCPSIPRPWSQDPSRSGDCLQESRVACGQPGVLQATCLPPSPRYTHTIVGPLCTHSDEHWFFLPQLLRCPCDHHFHLVKMMLCWSSPSVVASAWEAETS